MEEKSLLRVSLLISVAGLASLFLISLNPYFDKIPLAQITPDYIGRSVKVCGQVQGKFTSKSGHTFFKLVDVEDGSDIQIVAFKSAKISFDSKAVCVIGTVDLYQGDLELTAKSVVPDD